MFKAKVHILSCTIIQVKLIMRFLKVSLMHPPKCEDNYVIFTSWLKTLIEYSLITNKY